MTWTATLDVLADLGAAAVHLLWVPVLAWTVLAVPLWALVKRTDRLHANAEYRLLQMLLATLPMSIAATLLMPLLPAGTSVQAVTKAPVSFLPALDASAFAASAESATNGSTGSVAWQWTHVVGLATLAALGAALVSLGRLTLDAVAASRVRASLSEAPKEDVQALADRLADRLNIRRSVRACRSSEAVVPVTLGGIRPIILLPSNLAEEGDALRMALLHELVHVRRYDDWAHLAERLVAALFIAHPLVAALRNHIAAARERACDAAVLDDENIAPATYARLLVAFAEGNPQLDRLGALSLSESSTPLTDRLHAMRSSPSNWFASPWPLRVTLGIVGLVMTLGIAACSDSVDPVPSSASGSPAAAQEGIWTPITNARAAGDEWVRRLNEGDAQHTYDAASPMVASVEKADWSAWVEERRATIGAVQSRRFAAARLYSNLAPSDAPSVMLRYILEYESGARCQPAVVMVWTESTWKVGAYGPPSCSGLPFPSGASAATELSSSDALPMPAAGTDLAQRPGGIIQREVDDPQVTDAVRLPRRVMVDFVVDESGQPTDLQVQTSVHERLDETALRAIRALEFEPGRLNGEPVSTQMSVPVHFTSSNS